MGDLDIEREKFWGEFYAYAEKKTEIFKNLTPDKYRWIKTGQFRVSGFFLMFYIDSNAISVEIYLNSADPEKNDMVYSACLKEKSKIEKELGIKLQWAKPDSKHFREIIALKKELQWKEKGDHKAIFDFFIDMGEKFKATFTPRIAELKSQFK